MLKNVRQRVYGLHTRLLQCCMGHIVRNQENRALEYRVSLPVPSSRESRVGWRPGRGGTPATALLGPTVPVSPSRHFPTVKRVQYTITNFWWVMFGCSNDDVLETWMWIWLSRSVEELRRRGRSVAVRRGAQAVTGRGRPAQAARRSGLSLPRER